MSLAEDLWAAEGVVMGVEEKLFALFDKHKIAWQDTKTDEYDWSLEIDGCDHKLTKEQQVALGEFGFTQVWTHSTKRFDPNNKERHYSGLIKMAEKKS